MSANRQGKMVETTDLEEIKSTVSEAGMANGTVLEMQFKGKCCFNYNFFM